MKPSTVSLVVGLAIPVIMVIGIALAIIVPGLSAHPTTDFVYALGQYPSFIRTEQEKQVQHSYSVVKNKLTDTITSLGSKSDIYPYNGTLQPIFYIHNTLTDTNRELSFQEVQELQLSDEYTSPDGYTMTFGTSSGGVFPFFYEGGSDRATGYLAKGSASKKVTIISKVNDRSFSFVGWVLK